MIKLFSEEVSVTLTNSDHNVIHVEKLEEVFFEVYEFELNGEQYIRESVDKVGDDPVIIVPVLENNVPHEVPFIVKQGPQSVLYKLQDSTIVESFTDHVTFIEETKVMAQPKPAVAPNQVVVSEGFQDFSRERNAAIKAIRQESEAEHANRKKESSKIHNEVLSLEVAHIELNATVTEKHGQITEAQDKSEKAINKALSRLGQTNKELEASKLAFDAIKDSLDKSIEHAGVKVEALYAEKINEVQDSIVDGIRQKEILRLIKNSKLDIVAELTNTADLNTLTNRYIREHIAQSDFDPAKANRKFETSIKRDLTNRVSEEMTRLRRMVDMGGGGGTNAVQYANGGTMNGSLNVTGTILSGGIDISTLFGSSSGGGGGSTGTYDSNLASNLAMTEDVGGLDTGTTVASLTGQTYNQLFDSLLFPTVYPTVGSNNSTNLSDNVSNLQTIGAVINLTLTTTANLGTISLNGTTQGVYAGDVNAAQITGAGGPFGPGVGPGGTDIDNVSVTGHTVTSGSNSWTLTTTFAQGPMPLDSTGSDYAAIRFVSSTKNNSTSFEGVYPIKLGLGTGAGNFEDRALNSHSSSSIECSQNFSETVSIRHRIALADGLINGRTVSFQQWNPVSSSYSNIDSSEFTSSSTTFTIEGDIVTYTLYTKASPPGGGDISGQPIYKVQFN